MSIRRITKKLLYGLKPKNLYKRLYILFKTKKYHKEVVLQLKKQGFKNIQKYSLSTWKYYGADRVRLTYLSLYEGKKLVLKVTKGFDKKTLNGLHFITKYGNMLDFSPYGFEIKIDGYISYATLFFDSFSFNDVLQTASLARLSHFLEQFCTILDSLNNLGIVHCDLEGVNILVEKNSDKLLLIDFDTACSKDNFLSCSEFPINGIKYRDACDNIVYDDAFSVLTLVKRMPFSEQQLEQLFWFKELKTKVGRNTQVRKQ